jgi:hypothetical protein
MRVTIYQREDMAPAHPAPYSMGNRGTFPPHGVKQPVHDDDHSPSSNRKVKNMMCYTSNPHTPWCVYNLSAPLKTTLGGTAYILSNFWYYIASNTLILCNSCTWVYPSAFLPYADQERWTEPPEEHTTELGRISTLVLMRDLWNQYKTSDILFISLYLHTLHNKSLFTGIDTYDESRPCVSKNAAALWLKLV